MADFFLPIPSQHRLNNSSQKNCALAHTYKESIQIILSQKHDPSQHDMDFIIHMILQEGIKKTTQ